MNERTIIPLSERRRDIAILVFFGINILFITPLVDLEQLVIADPSNFEYPPWPPAVFVDLVHWWGRNFDPVLLARPAWWKMTIWIDQLFFGPFYLFAIYAFIKGRDWIRLPSVVYASVLITVVTIILGEECMGSHRTPELGVVLLANAPWLLFPLFILHRMWPGEHPFTRPSVNSEIVTAGASQL